MNDEIKEILEDVKRHLDYVEATKQTSIRDNEMKVMYDYITNLQEENMKLIGVNEAIKNLKYTVEETIYKTRINKAIEYIENNEDFETEIFDCNTGGCLGTDLSIQAKTLLNILQGKSDE